MKKILVLTLSLIMMLSLTSCGEKPADEQLKGAMINMKDVKSSTSTFEANITVDSETLTAVGMGSEFYISGVMDQTEDKLKADYTFDLSGMSLDFSMWGTKDRIYMTIPIYGATVYMDLAEMYEEDSETLLAEQEAFSERMMTFLTSNFELKDILVFDEAVKEKITINGSEVNATKIHVVPTYDKTKEVITKFLTFIKDDDYLIKYMSTLEGEAYAEDYKAQIEGALVDIEAMTQEEFDAEIMAEYHAIVQSIDMTFYLVDEKITRVEMDTAMALDADSMAMNIVIDMFNFNTVSDFELDEPEDAIPYTDMFGY